MPQTLAQTIDFSIGEHCGIHRAAKYVEIQRPLTRLVAVAATVFGSAQTETAYPSADAAMLRLWPVGLKSVVHHRKRLRRQCQKEIVGALVADSTPC